MVCRLCEKALSQNMNVLIYTQSADQAQQLDDLLWNYKTDSFIAHHNQLGESPAQAGFDYPVLISSSDRPDNEAHGQCRQLLINLTTETPPFYQHFERLAEMVDKEQQAKENARNRYRFYREQGHTLNKYDL